MSKVEKIPRIPSYIVPDDVTHVTMTLQKAQFEAYLVGGCVRDMILGNTPKDWDIATNAHPHEVQGLFPHTYYENDFGTVGIVNDETEDQSLKNIEVTTYRLEGDYSDNRHPDKIEFGKTIEDDLNRRDFTMNAIAISLEEGQKDISKPPHLSSCGVPHVTNTKDILKDKRCGGKGHIVDPYSGLKDIENRVIRTVLEPEKRFSEDALRIMRAVRFSSTLDFQIEEGTRKAMETLHMKLGEISKERIREEFTKIIMSDRPEYGLTELHELNLMQYMVPELEKAIGVEQGGVHVYDVWNHSLKALQGSANKGFGLETRLASLFHDIGKPKTRRAGGKNKEWTFFGHDAVGAKMVREIMDDLKFPRETTDTVAKLVRNHMFFSDTEQITLSAVRRMIRNVGKENIWDLINLRITDRIGNKTPKEEPYRLRKYKSMIEEVMRDPISVGMLEIDGNKILEVTHETPGPKVGYILHALLEEVLEDPKLNTKEYMERRAVELSKLDDFKLIALGEKGKVEKEKKEGEELRKIRGRNKVQ
jgi:tRNA nucleotidyltransferase (CCA-adding enzyme)